MKRLLALFLAVIFWVSCSSNSQPEGIIAQDKMINVLADVHLAEGYSGTVMDADTMKQVLADYMNLVYKKHQIDSLQFKKSLKYYSANPKLLNEMYDEVLKKLDAQQENINVPLLKE